MVAAKEKRVGRLPVRRVRVDVSDEQDLITGLIVSDEFCQRVLPMVRLEHLQGEGARVVMGWAKDYFERYSKAPGQQIQTIFDVEKRNLSEAESHSISALLATLSARFETSAEQNWEFQADKARAYIRSRALSVHADQVSLLRERGELDRAEELIRDFSATTSATSQWVSPLTDKALMKRALERVNTGTFRLEGVLGEVFGWWQPGWLVAFEGGYKRGKTWWLAEVARQAIEQGLPVAFVSLEMSEEDMEKRWLQMATALPETKGRIRIPVWDCLKNQDNSCTLSVRKNTEPLPKNVHDVPDYREGDDYRPCSVCMRSKKLYDEYRVATWFTTIKKRDDLRTEAVQAVDKFVMQFRAGKLLRMICPPRDSMTAAELDAKLDELSAQGMQPKLIIVDYAAIMRSVGSGEDWQQIDRKFRELSRLARERQAIVVTAAQVTTRGLEAMTLRERDTAGFRGILAHADLIIGLNQVTYAAEGRASERDMMVMRLNTIDRRHGRSTDEIVYVLQNLDLGQPAMDSFAVAATRRLLWESAD